MTCDPKLQCACDIKPFSVNHWGSHPDDENDDCFQGFDFDDLEMALDKFNENAESGVAFIEIDGLNPHQLNAAGIKRVRKNPNYLSSKSDNGDKEWLNEIAMEAGMMGGVDAYNESMGWDTSEPDDHDDQEDF